MKKEYMKPTTTLVDVKSQAMICVSGLDGVTQSTEEFGGGTSDSRGGSIWDDDDEWYKNPFVSIIR